MDREAFIRRHPRLFHMAEAGSWEQIRRDGLMSTSALLDHFGITGEKRKPIESARRPKSVEIVHPVTGETAVIRDNKPLNEKFLEGCLEDMTCQEWYESLNARVFFWVREGKLASLLRARAYRNLEHDVLTVDTRKLLDTCGDRITLAPINTGAAFAPNAAKRGSRTFLPIEDYPFDEYLRWRGKDDVITELAVDHSIESVKGLVLRVERRRQDQILEVIWKP